MKLTSLVNDVAVMSAGDRLFETMNWERGIPNKNHRKEKTWVAWFAIYYKTKWIRQA